MQQQLSQRAQVKLTSCLSVRPAADNELHRQERQPSPDYPKMWFTTFVLLAAFSITKGGEVYDVTTIYEVGVVDYDEEVQSINGRTHARTNALGLPLCVQGNNYFVSKDSQLYDITCDTHTHDCSWDTKDWTWIPTSDFEDMEETKAYKLTVNSTVSFENLQEHVGTQYLYFTSGASSIRNEELFFMVRLWRNDSEPWLFTGCTRNELENKWTINVKDRDGRDFTGYCASYHEPITFDYSKDYLSFHIIKDNVKIYRGLSHPSLQINWSPGPEYKEMKYYSVSGDNFHRFRPSVLREVLSATLEGSDMISPSFRPNSSQLCLVLVIHTPQDTRDDILHILAKDIYHSEHHLVAINNVKAGWNIKHANISLDEIIYGPIKIIIRKIGLLPVNITWISSCSSDAEEVELLDPFSTSADYPDSDSLVMHTPDLPIYTACSKVLGTSKDTPILNYSSGCDNGGVETPSGCACPPGFTGQKCQFGCGRNRFGQDCGGLCSFRLGECQGLRLCTTHTGCQCAPGYYGVNCFSRCSPDSYGNECFQQCGNCASGSPCDIYTGECFRCESGYHPPHCKQASVYYTSTPELSTPDYGQITVSFNPVDYVSPSGKPELYQIQYREQYGPWRIYVNNIMPENHDGEEQSNISETIEGLKADRIYEVRVLLMDANFNKYDGYAVQVSEILTKCYIPEEYDYKVNAVSDSTSFSFSWTYVNETEHWCPLISYEVSWKEGWKWSSSEISQGQFSLTGFLPGLKIKLRVRAKTSGGFAPFSKTILYPTQYEGTSAVWDLRVVANTGSSVALAWKPPRDSEGRQLQYTVTYKCVKQLACTPGCLNATDGHLTVDETSVTLSHLLPFAQYQVTVSPTDGSNVSIFVGTTKVVPTEVPLMSAQKPVRTNTSLTVFWDPAPVCSSFLLGYNYELVKESLGLKMLASGFTKDTTASFHNLTASTEYSVKVYVLTVAGWNPESFLSIKTSTSARVLDMDSVTLGVALNCETVPEAVRNLTVYKSGRNMLGVRWAAPHTTYGPLKSFTLTHELDGKESSHTVEPTTCVVWPDLYCHTILALKTGRKYNVTVSARNVDVPQDGVGASVTGITTESSPSAPEMLRLVNSSSTSLGLEWRYPNLANGVLRSFLVSVEETEMYDQDSCCQVYPLMEIPVNEETQTYEAEVSGLHPSSTYFASVSAKTVGLGPPQSMVVYTRPPHLPLTVLPLVVLPGAEQTVSWLAQEQLPEVNNSDTYTTLIQTQMLLAVLNETEDLQGTVDSGILDPKLNTLLETMISKPFYFVSEYTEDEEVILGSSFEAQTDSTWGNHPSPSPLVEGQQYQLVAVQVTKYYDVFNADLRHSTPFTL